MQTSSLAAAEEIRMFAAVVALPSEPGGIFMLKEEQKNITEDFFSAENMFSLDSRVALAGV